MLKFDYNNALPEEVTESSFHIYRTLFSQEINTLKENLFTDQILREKNKVLEKKFNHAQQINKQLLDQIEEVRTTSIFRYPIKKYHILINLLQSAKEYRIT